MPEFLIEPDDDPRSLLKRGVSLLPRLPRLERDRFGNGHARRSAWLRRGSGPWRGAFRVEGFLAPPNALQCFALLSQQLALSVTRTPPRMALSP